MRYCDLFRRASEYGVRQVITQHDGTKNVQIVLGAKRPVQWPYAKKKMLEIASAYSKKNNIKILWSDCDCSGISTEEGVIPKVDWDIVPMV